MLFKSTKEVVNKPVLVTPQDYVSELEADIQNIGFRPEITEIEEQIQSFEKRANDLHVISFRTFQIDDSLSTANQIADMMKQKLYRNIDAIIKLFSEEQEEKEKRVIVRKHICNNDMILTDLNSLLSYVLKVEEQEKDSLSEIDDTLVKMEDIYINELTKE